MSSDSPLQISNLLLAAMEMRMFVYHENRIPQNTAVVVVSNHRSFMDASVLMKALGHPLRTACHHYMGQVPVMREFVHLLGCFPLEEREQRQQSFFKQATELLKSHEWVAVFPEGAQPMIKLTQPEKVGKFHRGFAHLAFRTDVCNLAVLPVAIASYEENVTKAVPLRFLRLFDPSEPLFDQSGWHPMVTYQSVNVLIGHPYWITPAQREQYQGKQAKQVITHLTKYCRSQITELLAVGCN
ncbi:MAG: lysophospholipid acyltransferase family protein [Oscillatoria sp. PMC 1051.18]|nr:lysophospholipid acyltransferase family protein [Oscillatoria sp. PMC 1050.18]MEC5033145.1 lysophospholipid acyltransferase family protein [Oscillatoria sp. PMC 1051.18]